MSLLMLVVLFDLIKSKAMMKILDLFSIFSYALIALPTLHENMRHLVKIVNGEELC